MGQVDPISARNHAGKRAELDIEVQRLRPKKLADA
jgi:hypothetical protein